MGGGWRRRCSICVGVRMMGTRGDTKGSGAERGRRDEPDAGVYDFKPAAWEEVFISLLVDSGPLLV